MIGPFKSVMRHNAAVVVGETMALAVLQFLTFAIMTRLLSLKDIGLWVLISALLNFSKIADIWSTGLSSFVGQARGTGDMERAGTFVSTSIISGTLGYIGIIAIIVPALYFGAPWLVGAGETDIVRQMLPIMALTFWFQSMSGVYQLGLLGFGRPKFKAAQTVGGGLIFLVGVLVLAPLYGLFGVLFAQLAQAAAMLFFAIWAYHARVLPGARLKWDRLAVGELFLFGSKTVAVGVVQLTIEPIIRLLTNHFGGLSAVAIVDLAARLIAVVRAIPSSLSQVMVPRFAQLVARDGKAALAVYDDVQKLFVLLSIALFALLLSAAFAIDYLMLPQFEPSFIAYLWILTLGWIANSISTPAYLWRMSLRQLRIIFGTQAMMGFGAVILGIAGGYAFGILGALMGCSIAIAASSITLIAIGRPEGAQDLFASVGVAHWAKMAVTLALTGIVSALLFYFIDWHGSLFEKLTLSLVPIALCGLLLLATIKPKDIISLAHHANEVA